MTDKDDMTSKTEAFDSTIRQSLPTPVHIGPNSDGWYYVMYTDEKGKWGIQHFRFNKPVTLKEDQSHD